MKLRSVLRGLEENLDAALCRTADSQQQFRSIQLCARQTLKLLASELPAVLLTRARRLDRARARRYGGVRHNIASESVVEHGLARSPVCLDRPFRDDERRQFEDASAVTGLNGAPPQNDAGTSV